MFYGKRLAAIRQHRKMTQRELGRELKISGTQITRMESDKFKPDEEQIKALARALHCTVAELTDSLHAPLPRVSFRGMKGNPIRPDAVED